MPLNVAASTVGAVPDQAALAQAAIGQRNVRITPLQAAAMVAAVANNGVLMKPYLVAQELAPNLSVQQTASPQVQSTAMSPANAAALTTMMEHVVSNGTGTPAQIPGVSRRRQDRHRGHRAHERRRQAGGRRTPGSPGSHRRPSPRSRWP